MYFQPIFDLFCPHPPKPIFDLFLTYFNVFGVSGPLGGLLLLNLSGPISRDTAILSLRYPVSRDTFSGRLALPQNGAIPPLVLSFTKAHLCDTPFCNISRDNCAIPHENKHERVLRYYRYKYRAIRKVSLLGL